MCTIISFYALLILITTVQLISCKCTQSYVTQCDSFRDLEDNKETDTWTELMIGSDHSIANESVDLMKTNFYLYPKLINFYVIKKIKNLERNYTGNCVYSTAHLNLVLFYGNTFEHIDIAHFPSLTAKKFSLINNKIETITSGAFNDLQVEIFDVSDNLLEVIEAVSLPTNPRVKTISVKNNKVNYIEPRSFPDTLRSLHLDHNNLRHLSDEVIGSLNLQELTLSHNKFKTIPNISHMENLVFLNISWNAISYVSDEIFQQMNRLEVVDLSHNIITTSNILSFLTGPKKQPFLKISLAFNQLTHLNLTGVTLRKEVLILYGNPWDCRTWEQMSNTLIERQDECDKKFFSCGTMPYCVIYVNYRSKLIDYFDYPGPMLAKEIDRFHRTIKTSTKKPNCYLALHQHGIIDSLEKSCIA